MAKAILMSGGPGGIGSDDVTAGKAQVLRGYKTVTTDSDDEVVEGTIKSINTADDSYNINKSSNFGLDNFGRMYIDMPHGNGYYHRYDDKPHTCIDSVKLGDAVADKVLVGNTFTSKNGIAVQGTMANRGNVVNTVEFVNAYWESKFLARMEQGFYSQNGQYKPCVAIPYAILAQVAGVDRSKMLDTLTIAGKQGQIKSINTQDSNYRANKSKSFGIDGWSDVNNPVFWIDFPHGNGYYFRGDNHPHTCIDAVALGDATPDKVMRGFTATSKNGVKFAGTMPDLQSGRVVFNGATFDGVILSGVADKDYFVFRDIYLRRVEDTYRYSGVYDGGINLNLDTDIRPARGRYIGCIFSQSINLTPFKRIDVHWRFIGEFSDRGSANFNVGISSLSSLRRNDIEFNGSRLDGFSGQSGVSYSDISSQKLSGKMELNVAGINEQAFLYLYASANTSSYLSLVKGRVQVTKIEFFN